MKTAAGRASLTSAAFARALSLCLPLPAAPLIYIDGEIYARLPQLRKLSARFGGGEALVHEFEHIVEAGLDADVEAVHAEGAQLRKLAMALGLYVVYRGEACNLRRGVKFMHKPRDFREARGRQREGVALFEEDAADVRVNFLRRRKLCARGVKRQRAERLAVIHRAEGAAVIAAPRRDVHRKRPLRERRLENLLGCHSAGPPRVSCLLI